MDPSFLELDLIRLKLRELLNYNYTLIYDFQIQQAIFQMVFYYQFYIHDLFYANEAYITIDHTFSFFPQRFINS